MALFSAVLLLTFISICTGQYILEPKTTCEFQLNAKTFEIISEPTFIPVRSAQLAIAVSPCVHFKRVPNFLQSTKKMRSCNSDSRACVISGKSVINAGDRFIYTEIEEDGFEKEKVLMSINGDVCQDDKKYKVVIHFDCSRTMPSYLPPVNDEEDSSVRDTCTFHIRMISQNCKLHCMVRIAGQYLHLKDIATLADIVVPTGVDKKAILSMCRATTACDATNNTVACEVPASSSGNINGVINTTALGSANTEKILWDDSNQQVYLRSQIGTDKRNRIMTDIRLVCNWNEESKGRLVKTSSKMMTFEVESKYGCVKTPPKCKVESKKGNSYNLENLNTNSMFRDKSGKKIYLSICGPLKMPQDSICQKSYSQVCDQTGSINFGSIMRPIEVEQNEEFLTVTFTGGSACSQNSSLLYSTNIKFICSSTIKEPIFINEDKCSLNVLWETSEACPKYISSGKNCKVPNRYFKNGLLDLNGLRTEEIDKTVSLSKTLALRYNFCEKLNKPCNNITEVSMCLIDNGRESVLGVENTEVSFENGIIRSYFYNSYDFDEAKPNINVSFLCNHDEASQGKVSIYSIEDKVAYQMTVESQFACSTDAVHDCTLTRENTKYDLTPLMKNDSNYELSSNKFKMQINICRAVLTNSQVLCDLNSLVCVTNLTEPRLQKRYLSFGRNQKLEFNKDLTMKYTHGFLCPDSRSFYKETTIIFSCSRNKETGPVLVESNNCNHTITWSTKFACPKKFTVQKRATDCLIKAADKILYNFTTLRNHVVEIYLQNKTSMKLDICTGQFGETSRFETATRTLHLEGSNPYLQYDLVDNFTVYLYLQCDVNKTDEGFEINKKTSEDPKHTNITLRSFAVCEKKVLEISEPAKSVEVPEVEVKSAAVPEIEVQIAPELAEVVYKTTIVKEITSPNKNNCFVNSLSTLDNFPLNSLPPFYVQSEKHSYYIDFNNTANCKSYICKDNIPFEQYNNLNCPGYNLEGETVKIKFSLLNESAICKDKDLKGLHLSLQCADQDKTAVIKESDCYVLINHATPSICSFSNAILPLISEEDNIYEYKLGGIIAASVIVSILLVLTILRYFRKRRQLMSAPLCGCQEFTSLVKQD